jgi:hypothetical protein
MLSAARGPLGDGDAARLTERLGQQPVGLVAALVGSEVVAGLDLDEIQIRARHAGLDRHRFVGPRELEIFQLGLGERHVLAAGVLVALDHVGSVDDISRDCIHVLLLEPVPLGCKLIEPRRLGRHGFVELDGDRHHPERDGARPHASNCHR